MNDEPILKVRHLKKYFNTPNGKLHAVDDLSFTVGRGKTLGLVGESGCGKSTTGRTILRLIEPTSGEVIFEGRDINALNKKDMQKMRKDMQIIFQDPFSSIDPRKPISDTIGEPLIRQNMMPDKEQRKKRVLELMSVVGLAERLVNSYPHELDGGRRQRVGIARALALEPKFIVCDEPVSSLDVSIQAQILNLLAELKKNMGLTYLFITHDLSVVNHFSDDIAVMYLGKIVEKAPTSELFKRPLHPYTQALLSAIPVPKVGYRKERILLKGELTSPINPAPICRFYNRCVYASDDCKVGEPELLDTGNEHLVACKKVERELNLSGRA